MISICKNAEIPRSAYYRYFDSLEDSLQAVFENMKKETLQRFRQMIMTNKYDFPSLSIRVLEEMLNDEETYLFMTSLARDNTFEIPVLKGLRKRDFFDDDQEQVAIRNILMIAVKGVAEEFYTSDKSRDKCLDEYKTFIEIFNRGYKLK